MRIKKIATSIGVLGKILNSKSSSKQDTYSCDYINKDTEITKISNEDFIDLNTGFSIPTSSLYKQGKHIFGYITVQKNSNFLGTAENIGTLKIFPNQFINMFGLSGKGTDVYSIPTGQAHIYIQGNGILLTVVKSTESYIKFYIDYVTN